MRKLNGMEEEGEGKGGGRREGREGGEVGVIRYICVSPGNGREVMRLPSNSFLPLAEP